MKQNDKNQLYTSISEFKPSDHQHWISGGGNRCGPPFVLSEACIDAISILSAQLGIKQKSVFDHLMEDFQRLKNMAGELENTEFDRSARIQKNLPTLLRKEKSLRNF